MGWATWPGQPVECTLYSCGKQPDRECAPACQRTVRTEARSTSAQPRAICFPLPTTTAGATLATPRVRCSKPSELAVYDTADCTPEDGDCTTIVTMLDVSNNLAQKWQTVVMNASDPNDPCYNCFK